MKSQFATAVVLLLYLSVATVFGVVHHHEHQLATGHQDDCAACVWHVTGNIDAPVFVVPILFAVQWLAAPVVESVAIPHDFVPGTASRAPPVSPA